MERAPLKNLFAENSSASNEIIWFLLGTSKIIDFLHLVAIIWQASFEKCFADKSNALNEIITWLLQEKSKFRYFLHLEFVAVMEQLDSLKKLFAENSSALNEIITRLLQETCKIRDILLNHIEFPKVTVGNGSKWNEEITTKKPTFLKLQEESQRTLGGCNFIPHNFKIIKKVLLNLKKHGQKSIIANWRRKFETTCESLLQEFEEEIQRILGNLEKPHLTEQLDSIIVHRSNSVDSRRSEKPDVSDSSSVSEEDETSRLHSWLNRMEWVTSWYYGFDDDTLYIVVRDTSEKEVRRRLQDDNFHETGPLRIVADEPTSQRVVDVCATSCMC